MAEDRLYRAEVGAVLDHVAGTGMAQHVRANAPADGCLLAYLGDDLPDSLSAKLKYLASLGRKGGKARARQMTAEERKELARKAARARWDKKKTDPRGVEMESCPCCRGNCEEVLEPKRYYCAVCQLRFQINAAKKTIGMSMAAGRFTDEQLKEMADRWCREHGITSGDPSRQPDWKGYYIEAENRVANCEAKLTRALERIKELEAETA